VHAYRGEPLDVKISQRVESLLGRDAERDAAASFRTLLGEGDMLAYHAMMAPRLVEVPRVLRPTGSAYLHCDPTARHYLSEDVRRAGMIAVTQDFIATRAASVLCAPRGLRALRPVEAGHGGPRSTRQLRVDNRTIVSPALGLSGWRRWRRDPGESGALHCPDRARPCPWIKTSSVV
jgi:hypothetical protein